MVAVENRDEVPAGDGHGMIDVSRFGVVMFTAFDVACAHGMHERFIVRTAPVVQKVDVDFVLGPVEIKRRIDRGLDDVHRFIVRRNKDVDRGPKRAVVGEGREFSVEHPAHLKVPQDHHEEGIDFGRKQYDAQDDFGDADGA